MLIVMSGMNHKASYRPIEKQINADFTFSFNFMLNNSESVISQCSSISLTKDTNDILAVSRGWQWCLF